MNLPEVKRLWECNYLQPPEDFTDARMVKFVVELTKEKDTQLLAEHANGLFGHDVTFARLITMGCMEHSITPSGRTPSLSVSYKKRSTGETKHDLENVHVLKGLGDKPMCDHFISNEDKNCRIWAHNPVHVADDLYVEVPELGSTRDLAFGVVRDQRSSISLIPFECTLGKALNALQRLNVRKGVYDATITNLTKVNDAFGTGGSFYRMPISEEKEWIRVVSDQLITNDTTIDLRSIAFCAHGTEAFKLLMTVVLIYMPLTT